MSRFATMGDVRRAFDAMWHKANCAFSRTDRAAFNSWHRHLWKLADAIDEEAKWLPDEPKHRHLCRQARALRKLVNEVPWLEE